MVSKIQDQPATHLDYLNRFGSYQEFVRAFGADGVKAVAANLPGFKARDSQHLASLIPDKMPREALEDANRLVGNKISYKPNALKRVAAGVELLGQEGKFAELPEVFNTVLDHSEVIYMPAKHDLLTIRPNIIVDSSFNSPEAKTHSHKLLWLAKVMFDNFNFKDIMLPNISAHFFNTGTNSGIVANGGFKAFDFLDLGRVQNRRFINNTLLANREVRKLLDLARVKVVYDDHGIRIYVSTPQPNQLQGYGIRMSTKELDTLKRDLKEILLGLDGKPAVYFQPLHSTPKPHTYRTKLPVGLLMSLDAKTILEEITHGMPEHLKDRIFNDYHWFTDPQNNTLILYYAFTNSPKADRNLESHEILTAVKLYNSYPEIKVKLMNDMDHREYSLYLDSLEA